MRRDSSPAYKGIVDSLSDHTQLHPGGEAAVAPTFSRIAFEVESAPLQSAAPEQAGNRAESDTKVTLPLIGRVNDKWKQATVVSEPSLKASNHTEYSE